MTFFDKVIGETMQSEKVSDLKDKITELHKRNMQYIKANALLNSELTSLNNRIKLSFSLDRIDNSPPVKEKNKKLKKENRKLKEDLKLLRYYKVKKINRINYFGRFK